MTISIPSHSSETIKPSLISIEGAFNKQALNIEIFPVMGNPKVLVNLHGTFGSRKGSSGKYLVPFVPYPISYEIKNFGVSEKFDRIFGSTRKK